MELDERKVKNPESHYFQLPRDWGTGRFQNNLKVHGSEFKFRYDS